MMSIPSISKQGMKAYDLAGHAAFLCLFILAGMYSQERMINSDAAFYLFKIIHFKAPNIEHGRLSAVFSQIPLLSSALAGLSLKMLIMVYSLSFVLLGYVTYLISVSLLKNRTAGWTVILLLFMGVSDSFYRPVSESTQGLVFSTLLFAWIGYGHRFNATRAGRAIYYATGFLIILLCFFSHPLTVFPLLFICLFALIEKKDAKPIFFAAFIVLLYGWKAFTTAASPTYEGQKLPPAGEITRLIPGFFDLYSTKFLLVRLGNLYLPVLIILALAVLYYLLRGNTRTSLLIMVFSLAFVFINNLVYHTGDSDIAMEKNLMPLILFAGIPFLNGLIFGARGGRRAGFILLLSILVFGSVHITGKSGVYSRRLVYLERIGDRARQESGDKFIAGKSELDVPVILFTWSLGVETLIHSSLEGPVHSVTIYSSGNPEGLAASLEEDHLFLCVPFWMRWDARELDPRYFSLSPGPYKPIRLNGD